MKTAIYVINWSALFQTIKYMLGFFNWLRICNFLSNIIDNDLSKFWLTFVVKKKTDKRTKEQIKKTTVKIFICQVKPQLISPHNVIPNVTTHNPWNPEVFNIIRNNLPILERNLDMRKIWEASQIIKNKRQSPSLTCRCAVKRNHP